MKMIKYIIVILFALQLSAVICEEECKPDENAYAMAAMICGEHAEFNFQASIKIFFYLVNSVKCPNETGYDWFNRVRQCFHQGTTDYAKQLIDDSNKLSPPECYKHVVNGGCKLMEQIQNEATHFYNCSKMMMEALPFIKKCDVIIDGGLFKKKISHKMALMACGNVNRLFNDS